MDFSEMFEIFKALFAGNEQEKDFYGLGERC